MKEIAFNQQAAQLLTAWQSAKDAEKAWTEYRRQVEEQLLALHHDDIEAMEEELNAGTTLSTAAGIGTLKLDVKRSIELDQAKVCAILAEAPFLAGVLFKCSWSPVASRSLFAALAGQGEVAEKLKDAVSFKMARPYFTQK